MQARGCLNLIDPDSRAEMQEITLCANNNCDIAFSSNTHNAITGTCHVTQRQHRKIPAIRNWIGTTERFFWENYIEPWSRAVSSL